MNAQRLLRQFSIAGLAALAFSAPAQAGFLGQQMQADYRWPNVGTTYCAGGTATVGAGVEFIDPCHFGVGAGPNADVSDTNILITYPAGFRLGGSGSFDGWVFSLLSAADIVGVSLAGTNLAGFTAAGLTFDADHVYVNTLGLGSWGRGTMISVDVSFDQTVPEPASLALVGLALAGAVASRRRRAA